MSDTLSLNLRELSSRLRCRQIRSRHLLVRLHCLKRRESYGVNYLIMSLLTLFLSAIILIMSQERDIIH